MDIDFRILSYQSMNADRTYSISVDALTRSLELQLAVLNSHSQPKTWAGKQKTGTQCTFSFGAPKRRIMKHVASFHTNRKFGNIDPSIQLTDYRG